ncbi:hypothetical protein D3C75_1119610 [compost metagenome]
MPFFRRKSPGARANSLTRVKGGVAALTTLSWPSLAMLNRDSLCSQTTKTKSQINDRINNTNRQAKEKQTAWAAAQTGRATAQTPHIDLSDR